MPKRNTQEQMKNTQERSFCEKWLEENEGETREEWNPKEDMKAMEEKYEIKWETEPKQPSLMRFVQPRGGGVFKRV